MIDESDRGARRTRDEAAMKYVRAIDRDDLDTLAKLWEQAETDPELERTFLELNQGLIEEAGVKPEWSGYRNDALGAIERHLPQSLDREPPLPPLAVGDIAARIAGDPALLARLTPSDREANEQLRAARTLVPQPITNRSLASLAAGLSVQATTRYWREFQQVAVMLSVSRGHAVARAAARDAGRPRRPAASQPPPATRKPPAPVDAAPRPEEPK